MKQLNWYQIFGKSNIPDGRTVLPTDDIQIWLHCANIWDKTYTTLAEVLADTDTLLALITSNNAVDYMVRSTTWAVQVTVPTMTDNTHPSGQCVASNALSSNQPWKAFDKNTTTLAVCSSVTDYIGYVFDTPIELDKAVFTNRNSSDYPITFKIQYTDDGETWSDLTDTLNNTTTPGASTTFDVTSAKHRGYCFKGITANTSAFQCAEIQFYSNVLVNSATAMTYIGQNNYASNTLLDDATWREAILNSDYFESVINVRVPYMTSNTTPSGVASASSSINSSNLPWMAFNEAPVAGVEKQKWYSTPNSTPQWLRYQFTSKKLIKWARVQNFQESAYSNNVTLTFKIQGSNDASTWVDLTDTITMNNKNNFLGYIYALNNDTEYQYYQMYCISYTNTTAFLIQCLQFYGREDV